MSIFAQRTDGCSERTIEPETKILTADIIPPIIITMASIEEEKDDPSVPSHHHGGNFDHAAEDYDEKAAKIFKYHTSVIETIRQKLGDKTTNEQSLFEFGCGTGNICLAIADQFQHVYGVDVSAKMLAKAHAKIADTHCENATLKQMALSDDGSKAVQQLSDNGFPRNYDWIVCSMVLHHMPIPMATLELFSKLLTNDSKGQLIIVEFGAAKDGNGTAHSHASHNHHHGHAHQQEHQHDKMATTEQQHSAHNHSHAHAHNHDCNETTTQEYRDQYGIFTSGFDLGHLQTALKDVGFTAFDAKELPPLQGMEPSHPFYGLPLVILFASK
jgi:predicted TPR repeat methyltransferase